MLSPLVRECKKLEEEIALAEDLKFKLMRIRNVHERRLAVPGSDVASLIDGLAGADDRLWPHDKWPSMRFDRPLEVGAIGGHGPVRYRVSEYTPGQRIAFQFRKNEGLTRGFDGGHCFDVEERGGQSVLRHVVEADSPLPAYLRWLFLVGPLHDALLEDALDRAVIATGGQLAEPSAWSPWVKLLRGIAGAKSRKERQQTKGSGTLNRH